MQLIPIVDLKESGSDFRFDVVLNLFINTSYSLSMAGVKTRRRSASKLSEFVGPAKEVLPSEVPTLRAIIQRGLLVRDRLLLEQGSAKTEIHTKDIIAELVPLISNQ